ncbi:hypothetical protein ACOSOI_000482 [Campylobacter upsaliensis]
MKFITSYKPVNFRSKLINSDVLKLLCKTIILQTKLSKSLDKIFFGFILNISCD